MKITDITSLLKLLRDNEAVVDDVEYLSFIATLIPVPGVQQAGQVLNRIASNHSLKLKLDEIRNQIYSTDSEIQKIHDELEKVQKIAFTVDKIEGLEDKITELIKEVLQEIKNEDSEFIVDTQDWSVQVLVEQIIKADLVTISAVNNSQNFLKNSEIQAKKTHLIAKDRSINVLDNTDLSNSLGKTSMRGIRQYGEVDVEGNSTKLNGGALEFGPNGPVISGHGTISGAGMISSPRQQRNLVSGRCPNPLCTQQITVEREALTAYSKIQCPACKNTFNFTVN